MNTITIVIRILTAQLTYFQSDIYVFDCKFVIDVSVGGPLFRVGQEVEQELNSLIHTMYIGPGGKCTYVNVSDERCTYATYT